MLDVKALLTKILLRLSNIGTRYYQTSNNAISNTSIDNNTVGASVTVPPGTYLLIAYWPFNTRSSSGTTNSAIRILNSSDTTIAQQRVYAADSNWNALQCMTVVTPATTETFRVSGATSRAYTSATMNWILAVRLA